MRVAIFVSGRGSNMEAILNEKKKGNLPNAEIALVLSDKADAPALEKANAAGVKTVFVDSKPYRKNREGYDAEVLKVLREHNIEFIVLAGFMRIITPVLIEAFSHRIINIHPALLPAFPGLHAQKQALDYGVKVSGCTVHFVDAGMDTGPIILQTAIPVNPDDTEDTLSARILEFEHRLLPRALDLATSRRLRVDGRKVYLL
ncbi:MAG TPA: phosphoribosylglycinamide formyltransferase [Candidatus Sumerlaeota bacterium]|nr:MAG: Phosphoribosylglycinamide formyltransferase [candidate division BRC1 bacterium ADurb.Bin183]HOE63416.1 phosphoribosylglycinamide formyltransferase [Candidatus Sumerlaeota bacterium]HRR30282.1 phosphoribosylglycinamide formyltransferase [Candidatus Sumerlaeia bacterium]HON50895.1 phosphoribosylglycinamide formyltransferase [Candidatus Sumerlaeota bacterium]HOR65589.1 phosphoribosylglycinamide formyltransferase [Candidatus Sumerlaeota bacterium]